MLHYPKIPDSRDCPGGRCIAFEKYDGTNFHFDWRRGIGWHSFGTRRDAFAMNEAGNQEFLARHGRFDDCVELFRARWAEPLETIFRRTEKYRAHSGFKVFAEYFGAKSFAGTHQPDDPKTLRVFDISSDERGQIGPWEFVADFGHLPIARVVFQGKFTGQFAEDVRAGKYKVAEGVVCKGGTGGDDLWMAKIKTNAYRERLKQAFQDKWDEHWE